MKKELTTEKTKERLDFSRKVLVWASVSVLIIILASFGLMWSIQDLSSLNEIILGSFAMLGTVTGFVIWKEKNESLLQIMRDNPELRDEVLEELEEELEGNIKKDF